jgi:signal transduction histidine kinase
MEERVRIVNGTFEIISKVGFGTNIKIEIPIKLTKYDKQ